jgi:hypothetical protein
LRGNSSSETQTGFLLESGTTLTGGLQLSGQTVSGQAECAGVGAVQGQAHGSQVAMTVTQAGRLINLTGAAASDFTGMNGSYSTLSAGCGQTEVGSWTATAIKPLNGNVQMTFTSDVTAVVFHFTGKIAQGANTGQTTATLSGSMTSTDAPCPSSASIGGVISGTSVILNFQAEDGSSLGKFEGTMTTDGSSVSGFYRFSNASVPSACNDIGGAVISVQAPSGM